MKVSIISYSFFGLQSAGMRDAFGYLESVRYRYGLDAADLWSGSLASTDDGYIEKVKEALAGRELTLACLAVDGAHIWDPDPLVREEHHQRALAYLRIAERLGARAVRIDMGGEGDGMSAEQLDLVVQRYREYARRACDHGYKVGPENHWGPALVPEIQKRVYEAVGSPAYGVMLHAGRWIEGHEDEGDRLVAPWVFHAHVDWRTTTTCLAEKMAILRAAGYQGYWSVEHHSGVNEYAEVAIQVAMVRDALARVSGERS